MKAGVHRLPTVVNGYEWNVLSSAKQINCCSTIHLVTPQSESFKFWLFGYNKGALPSLRPKDTDQNPRKIHVWVLRIKIGWFARFCDSKLHLLYLFWDWLAFQGSFAKPPNSLIRVSMLRPINVKLVCEDSDSQYKTSQSQLYLLLFILHIINLSTGYALCPCTRSDMESRVLLG